MGNLPVERAYVRDGYIIPEMQQALYLLRKIYTGLKPERVIT